MGLYRPQPKKGTIMHIRGQPHYLALYGNFDRLKNAGQKIPESYFDYLKSTQTNKREKTMKNRFEKKENAASASRFEKSEIKKIDKPVLTAEGLAYAREVKEKIESFIFSSKAEQEKQGKKIEQILSLLANDGVSEVLEKLLIIENRIDSINNKMESIQKPTTEQPKTASQAKENENQGDSPYQKFLSIYGKDFDKGHFNIFYNALSKVKNPTQETLDSAFKALWANNKKLASPRSFADLKPAIFSLFLSDNALQEKAVEKKPTGKAEWAKVLGVQENIIQNVFNSLADEDCFDEDLADEIESYILSKTKDCKTGDLQDFISHCENLVLNN